MKKQVGNCGLCGARVFMPEVWLGVDPPVPTCESCGATAKNTDMPTLDMERPLYRCTQRVNTAGLDRIREVITPVDGGG